jgi:hypothetical protein
VGHPKPAGNFIVLLAVVVVAGPEAQPASRPMTPQNTRIGMSRFIMRPELE